MKMIIGTPAEISAYELLLKECAEQAKKPSQDLDVKTVLLTLNQAFREQPRPPFDMGIKP